MSKVKVEVDEKVLEGILMQLGQIVISMQRLTDAVESYNADLKEFAERFDETMVRLENERRLDWEGYN